MISISENPERSAMTRWSMLVHPADPDHPEASSVLGELGQRYCYPVYTYLRRCGHAPASARSIAGNFLDHLVWVVRQEEAPQVRTDFRSFLLDRLNAYLTDDAPTPAPPEPPRDRSPLLPDLEARYQHDQLNAGTPEHAYQRSFALEVIARALLRLRNEAGHTGHQDMFGALQPYLGSDPASGVYDELAAKLKTRPLALVLALKRLRQRFRELVGQELADTVASARDLADEHRTLHNVLRGLS